MTASSPSSLGDFFSRLFPFDLEERTRLASLAGLPGAGSLPAHIINAYALRTESYNNGFLKRERIPGARRGSSFYKQQAIQRIVRALGDPSHVRYKLCWCLYNEAAIMFIKHELPALQRLLAEVSPPDGTHAVPDMLKAICANASEYGVTPAEITTFYQIWGVPRIENFEAMLPQWITPDNTNADKRQLTRAISEAATLRAVVEELRTTLNKHTEALTESRREVSDSLERHRSLEKSVKALSQQVSELTASSARVDATRSLGERVSGLAEKVQQLADKAKQPREEVSKSDLHKLANGMKVSIDSSMNELTDGLTKRMREELSNATSELEGRIAALSADVRRHRDPTSTTSGSASAVGYRSPLVSPPSRTHAPYKLATELDFVNSWRSYLSQVDDIALTFEQAAAYHRAFLGSPVIVCDRSFALSWIHCLAWGNFTLHMAASPTWSSEEDWGPGAEHLFRRDNSRSPRVLVVHNYDVGLPDCYLAPSLSLWALQREPSLLSKLFLVPARHDHTPSAPVLEHALCFTNNEYIVSRPLALKDGVRVPPSLHRTPMLGADPDVVRQWATPGSHISHDLAAIQRALKCRMPADLITSFQRTTTFIARYIAEASAIALTMHHQVIPWVQETYGDAKAAELSNLVADGADR